MVDVPPKWSITGSGGNGAIELIGRPPFTAKSFVMSQIQADGKPWTGRQARPPAPTCRAPSPLGGLAWFWPIIALLLTTDIKAGADQSPTDAQQLFVRRIAPLLREKCIGCHGVDPEKIEGSLDLTKADGLARGGDSGVALVKPGDPESSPFYLAVRREDDQWSAMPPKDAERLTQQQLGWVRSWIQDGADWPDAKRQSEIANRYAAAWSAEDGISIKTSGGLSDDWTNRKYQPAGLWAYRPVRKPGLDANRGGDPQPIDQLIARQLPEGITPAPRADRLTLIRRATFDLIGLPPKPEEVEAFGSDRRSDREAFAAVVNRLLDSPHYGERMAQHWLDVVRYADSSGFANDFERGNAWRYRDYVIRAFNNDKPYDQFVREQIAGDEINPEDPELIIATGFLRMGPWELTGMEVARVARQRFLDDVTNSIGETFLAHSLQCARCHDHKFDPIPTRDYYSIQAVFATTQLAERAAPFLPEENLAGFAEQAYLKARGHDYQKALDQLDEILLANAGEWFAKTGLPRTAWDAALQKLRGPDAAQQGNRSRGIFNAARNLLLRQGVSQDEFPPKLVGFTPRQFGQERVARKGLERLKWELDRYQPFALAVYDGRTPDLKSVVAPTRMPANRMHQGELEATCILTGGDPFATGEALQPGVLSVLATPAPPEITTGIAGRRKAFAQWVASAENPLTARTVVNRIWLWHFNRPIAGNPNNFGSTGKPPTHPELLDWLAATFVETGWSFKSLHRQIMNSEAYCRDSQHPDPPTLAARDPLGASYAVFRPRRLTAEEIRDAMLVATGELNPELGGIPNRPEINLEAALQPRQVMGTFASAWTPNPLPSQRQRRSIYALKLRGLVDPMREVFNAPTPDFSCERRQSSTVTPQVFSLFNGQNTHSRALALADRAVRETQGDDAALRRCFQLAYARQPNAEELTLCRQHWQQILAVVAERAPAPREIPKVVQRDAVEENTGEKFSFQETLYSNADFVSDLQPHQVNRRTRALADVCLALFNSNEFVYVY